MHLLPRLSELTSAPALLGLIASALVVLSAPRLLSNRWWFDPHLPGGRSGNTVVLYVGVAMLMAAWLEIGRRLRHRSLSVADLVGVLVLWSVPLMVGPPIFSDDVYSYLAQGTLLHLGLNPYHVAPSALIHLHHVALANAVSPFWRSSTSPYGPLFIALMDVISAISSSLTAGVVLAHAVELAGVLALALSMPTIARSLGADPLRAVWLACLSPLTLLELVAPGHNDALMIGLMAVGVAAAARRHPLLGIAICSLASAVKAPAAVAAVAILLDWLRSKDTTNRRIRALASAAGTVCVILISSSLATGLGVAWLSPSVLATPGRVHLAITPVSQAAWIVHALDASISVHAAAGPISKIALAAAILISIAVLICRRSMQIAHTSGIILLTLAALGPAAWPWYFCWGVALLAAEKSWQQSRVFVAAVLVSVIIVKPDGILLLPFGSAPIVLAVYVTLAVLVALQLRRGRATREGTSPHRLDAPA